MISQKTIKTITALLLLMMAASCTFPTGGSLPTCANSSLLAPVQTGPAMWAVVNSLSPTLSWTYPDASCNPQGYAIRLETGPFFTDSLGGGTGNPSTTWGPGSPLQPGREYAWGVRAINGTTLGPFAGSSYFFTGPMCATVRPGCTDPARTCQRRSGKRPEPQPDLAVSGSLPATGLPG